MKKLDEKLEKIKSGIGNVINTFILLSPPREQSLEDVFNSPCIELMEKITKYHCGQSFTPKNLEKIVNAVWKPHQVARADEGVKGFYLKETSTDIWNLLDSLSYKRDTEEKQKKEKAKARVYTPKKLIECMINELPEEVLTNVTSTFLDPACGRGVFLLKLKEVLMNKLSNDIIDEEEREKHILENMLFGRDVDPIKVEISKKVLDYKNKFNVNISTGDSLDKELMMKEYKGRKFDVVIGNPPYNEELKNSGKAIALYPPFVELAHEMTDKYVMMITPHKWTTLNYLKGHKSNMIHKYGLKYIKLFKDASKIFGDNIIIKGGVSYFLCEKNYKGKVNFHIGEDEKYKLDLKELNDLPRFIGEDLLSILNKLKSDKYLPEIFTNNTKIKTNDKRMKEEKEKETDIVVHASRGRVLYVSEKHKDDCKLLNDFKVAIPFGLTLKDSAKKSMILKPGETGNQSKVMFKVSSEKEAKRLVQFMDTTVYKFITSLDQTSHATNGTTFMRVPLPTLDVNWDDEKAREFFKLTKKEYKFMKECVEKAELY